MYIMPEMIDLGLAKDETWPSEFHKNVAMSLLLQNPLVTKRDDLMYFVSIINKLSVDEVKKWTLTDAINAGFPGLR